jgi:RNA methyltransferase, TrmH family
VSAEDTEGAIARIREARDDPAFAVLEGFHALKHGLRFGAEVEAVVSDDPEALDELARALAPDLAGQFRELATTVSEDELRSVGRHPPHTRVVAVARRPAFDAGDAIAARRDAPVVFLEDPRNLGNLGAVVRVAAAADAAAVLTTGPADPWDPAALRGSAGLHYALPVGHAERLDPGGRPLIAVHPGGEPLDPARLPGGAVLAFGSERHGLGDELLSRADARVGIPMRSGVSSLNLATAVAAVLFACRTAVVARHEA